MRTWTPVELRAVTIAWARNRLAGNSHGVNARNRAFTLVELLIVIIIVAVLASIVVPHFQTKSLHSKEAALKSTLQMHRSALERFHADTGRWPRTLNALARETVPTQVKDDDGTLVSPTGWNGPYLIVPDNAAPLGIIARDPVSGLALDYAVGSPKGARVRSSASGRASDGTFYSTW